MKSTKRTSRAKFSNRINPSSWTFGLNGAGRAKCSRPTLDEIAEEQIGHVKVAKVNVDNNPALAARFGIQSIPTLLYFAGGEVKDKTVGVVGKRAIVSKLEKLAVPV